MKTAVAELIEDLNNNPSQCTLSEFLEMLKYAQIIQDTQIKLAYMHGGLAVLQKTEVKSDEYFAKEFEK